MDAQCHPRLGDLDADLAAFAAGTLPQPAARLAAAAPGHPPDCPAKPLGDVVVRTVAPGAFRPPGPRRTQSPAAPFYGHAETMLSPNGRRVDSVPPVAAENHLAQCLCNSTQAGAHSAGAGGSANCRTDVAPGNAATQASAPPPTQVPHDADARFDAERRAARAEADALLAQMDPEDAAAEADALRRSLPPALLARLLRRGKPE